MTSSPLHIGVIGAGFGTKVHVPGFQSEGVEVVAICTRHKETAEKAAHEHGIPHVFTDYREMLRHPGLDAVSITTPPPSHLEMVTAALDAGKHVICEKAFAMDQKEARAMWRKAEATGLTGMVAHEFRFAPARAYVRDLLQQGYVGDVRTVSMNLFIGPTSSRGLRTMNWGGQASQGGGFLKGLGSHYIDCMWDWSMEMTRVCGSTFVHDPERLDPATGQKVRADADEAFAFMATLKNGGWATMSATTMAPFGRSAMIQIYGSQGTLQTPQAGLNPPPDGVVLGAKIGQDKEVHELPVPSQYRPFDDPRDERLMAFRLLVRRFLQGIAEGNSPSPNFHDGLRCQQVLDAVSQSATTGRWVDIAEG